MVLSSLGRFCGMGWVSALHGPDYQLQTSGKKGWFIDDWTFPGNRVIDYSPRHLVIIT
jgi:hypothetical protein